MAKIDVKFMKADKTIQKQMGSTYGKGEATRKKTTRKTGTKKK